jgi:uncharacterized DUF497 family protein
MFQWDAGNIDKNMRHGVHDWEIEEALLDPRGRRIDSTIVNSEERYIWLGRATSSGKYLRVVYTLRQDATGHTVFRPISAVEMSTSEKRRYRRQ